MFGANEKEICGHSFRTAKNGLDETDISSFIETLIKQNKELSDKLDNLESLVRFAHKMVDEAQDEAETIRAEAAVEARARAESIIAEGEQAARVQAERVIAVANERARSETARLQEEAEQYRVACRKDVELELRSQFDALCADLLSCGEHTAVATPAAAEHDESSEQIVADTVLEAEEADTPEEEEYLQLEPRDEVDEDRVLDAIAEEVLVTEDQTSPAPEEDEPTQTLSPAELATSEEADVETTDDQPTLDAPASEVETEVTPAEPECDEDAEGSLYEGTVRLTIPPPIRLGGLMALHRQLKDNPDIEVGNVTGSAEDGARLDLHLPTRIPLLQLLGSLQGVEEVSHGQCRDIDEMSALDDTTEDTIANTIQLRVS
jgi:F0F1-type ATP synthase membrane subunit b/b'